MSLSFELSARGNGLVTRRGLPAFGRPTAGSSWQGIRAWARYFGGAWLPM